jgi:hypothetical protein
MGRKTLTEEQKKVLHRLEDITDALTDCVGLVQELPEFTNITDDFAKVWQEIQDLQNRVATIDKENTE